VPARLPAHLAGGKEGTDEMTNVIDGLLPELRGLPDPERDRRFYDGVPGRRFAAWLIDLVIVVAFSIIVIPVFGILTLGLGFFVAPAVFAVLSFVYRTWTITSRSATWGMRLMGIELRDSEGRRLDFGMALAHVGLYTISLFLTLPLLVTVFTVLTTRYGQTLHDIVLRTTAINAPED
jgi:uncharacterized RDD family membrane protein YckC